MTGLGPNDLQPCGTTTAARRHAALGQICTACDPLAERRVACPRCGGRVTALGDTVLGHLDVDGLGCTGAGAEVPSLLPAGGVV